MNARLMTHVLHICCAASVIARCFASRNVGDMRINFLGLRTREDGFVIEALEGNTERIQQL
jgi:hypothetical protein